MYSFITCFSAIVIIAELCSADRRIVGGKEININEVPYQVSLVRNGRHWCGGALLSKKFVLTAAHCQNFILLFFSHWLKPGCLLGTLDNPITHVRVGSSHQDEGDELIEVFESIEHPQYNKYSAYDFDIAILRLNDSQAFPEIHSFAKIPRRNSELKVGELTIVSGWGDTKNPLESPKHLRAAKVPIISQASCKKVYKKSLTENMFCAGYSDGGKIIERSSNSRIHLIHCYRYRFMPRR